MNIIPKEVIEKAIEGGWKGLYMDEDGITVDTQSQIAWGRTKTGLGRHLPLQVIALDRTFWEALGKALGWDIAYGSYGNDTMEEWQSRAMTFFNIILTNGDTDAFWEKVLSNNLSMTNKPKNVEEVVRETVKHIMTARTHGQVYVERYIREAFNSLLESVAKEVDEMAEKRGYTLEDAAQLIRSAKSDVRT